MVLFFLLLEYRDLLQYHREQNGSAVLIYSRLAM